MSSPCTWQRVCKPDSQCESDLGAQATMVAKITLSPEGWATPAHGKDPPDLSEFRTCPVSLESKCRPPELVQNACPAQVPGACGPAHFPPPNSSPLLRRPGRSEERVGPDSKWSSRLRGVQPGPCWLPEHPSHQPTCSLHLRSWGSHCRPSLDTAPCSLMLDTARRQEGQQ